MIFALLHCVWKHLQHSHIKALLTDRSGLISIWII